jgi:PAS domain S-box-containing protein
VKMRLSIQSKLSLGIGVLFALLLTVSIVAFAFIHSMTGQTEDILKDNSISIRYCNQMLSALDALGHDSTAVSRFEQSLQKQEDNVTEKGESEATQKTRFFFERIKSGNYTTAEIDSVNTQLYKLSEINQQAIERKNDVAVHSARNAALWISVLTAVFVLIGFTLAVNIPGAIASPIKLLTAGIRAIANKDYKKRIYLDNKDELGEMAGAFNSMAEKLYEYEHSNLSQLMFEKKRVETIINQMEDAVIGLDAHGHILFINSAAAALFHLKADDIVGKYAPDVALYNDLLRTVLQKEHQQPLRIVVNGKENYFSLDTRVVFNEDQRIGDVFTLRNITSFKELDISKTNLLATISHELKTPISSIRLSTQLITDARVGELNEEQQELIGNIKDDTERLLKLTGELLNMTQLESGKIQLKLAPVPVLQVIDKSLQAVLVQAQQKEIVITTALEQNLPDIYADADKTSWVLVNLLSNAIKYAPEKSTVTIGAVREKNAVRVSVKDMGPGIEPVHAAQIFDRYYKVPGSEAQDGTGLGLSISKEFIEAQGGRLYLESTPGEGSTFFFELPFK